MWELESTSSRFGHSFANFPYPRLGFALALDARWLIVPTAPSFRKHPILLNFTGKPFDGSFKRLAISYQNLCHLRFSQPGMQFVMRTRGLASFLSEL